jgi:S-disulfanyl-L-cysteine oxidoreductase SoxD
MRGWRVIAVLVGGSAIFQPYAAGTPPMGSRSNQAPIHYADANDLAKVIAGKALYGPQCGSCHGKRLQGQPLWQLEDEYAHRRAPAHDQSGHTWLHSDEELYQMTRNGRFPAMKPGEISNMPAFRDSLTDEQMLSVIAYIKASWPVGLRIAQAMLNPGNAGMPVQAADTDWTLPPNCTISLQRWRATSR